MINVEGDECVNYSDLIIKQYILCIQTWHYIAYVFMLQYIAHLLCVDQLGKKKQLGVWSVNKLHGFPESNVMLRFLSLASSQMIFNAIPIKSAQ